MPQKKQKSTPKSTEKPTEKKRSDLYLNLFLGLVASALLYYTLYGNQPKVVVNTTNVLINTDRKVEGQIIKDYFKGQKQYNVVSKYERKQHTDEFYLQWAHYHWDIDYKRVNGNKIVSHMQNAENTYDDKNQMFDNIKEYDYVTNYKIKGKDFLPETYTWDAQKSGFSQSEKDFLKVKNGETWIIKNPRGQGGKGIKLEKNIERYAQGLKAVKGKEDQGSEYQRFRQAQKYISNPLLVNGRKAEYRAYVLIPTSEPYLVIFNKGFLKSALKKYDNDSSDLSGHLTNLAEARKNVQEYDKVKNSLYLNVEQLESHIINNMGKSQSDVDRLYEQIISIVTYTMIPGLKKLYRSNNTFETFAFDILLDEDLKPYLLEINQPYAVEGAMLQGYKDVLPDFYNSSLDLILQLHESEKSIKQQLQNPENLKLGKYMTIVYNEATGYNYLDEKML